MARGTRTIEDPTTGIRIMISRQAQFMIGTKNVDEFAELLRNIMLALGAETVYVSKRGFAVEINLQRSNGWRGTMTVKKGEEGP